MFFRPGIWVCSKSPFILFDPFAFVCECCECCEYLADFDRRGCAAFVGRDVSKLKGKGGGKFKYMSENDMLELAAKFAPYR